MIQWTETGRGTPGAIAAGIAIASAIASTIIASAILASTAAIAVPGYDGLWSVSIVTEKGDCDRGYRYPVRIMNGTLANAGDTAVTISGKVAGSGAVTVSVSAGGRSANGSGRLAGKIGMGSWNGSWSGGSCSGSWSAERRGP